MRKLAPTRVSYWDDFLISYHVYMMTVQRAKKVVSNSPGLVDFATGLVNSVLNLPYGQVKFCKEFKL